MKNIILSAICLFVLAAGSASAQQHRRYYPRNRPQARQQEPPAPKVKFELMGGLNVSNVVNVNNYNFSTGTLAGFNAGVGIEAPFGYGFAFEPEVLYSGKGFSANTSTGQFNQRTNWIDVPLLLKFKPTPYFNFVVGPQISFLLSTQNTFINGYTAQTQTLYNNAVDGYNKTLIGGVVGVGFELSPNLELRARYTIDLQSTAITGVSDIPQYNNQVWQIGLAAKFF